MWQFNTQIPNGPSKVSSSSASVPVRTTTDKTVATAQSAPAKSEMADLSFLLPVGKSHYQDSALSKDQVSQIQKLTLRLSDYLEENKKSLGSLTKKDILELYDLSSQSPQDEIIAEKILSAFKTLQDQSKNVDEWTKLRSTNETVLKNLSEDLTKLSRSPFKVYNPQKFKKINLNSLKIVQDVEPQRSQGKILNSAQIKALNDAKAEVETLKENVQLFLSRNSESNLEQASVGLLLEELQKLTGVNLTTLKLSTKEKLEKYVLILKERAETLKKSVDVQNTLAVMEGRYQGLENIFMITDTSFYESDPAIKLLKPYFSNDEIKKSLEKYGVILKNNPEMTLQDKKSLLSALTAIKSLTEDKERRALFFTGDENYNLRLVTQHILETRLRLDSEAPHADPIRKKAADHAKKTSAHYFEIKKQAHAGLQRLGLLDEFSSAEDRLKAEQINLNLCGSCPGLAARLAKFDEQDKKRYLDILKKLLNSSVGLDDFMFLSGVENTKGVPDIKTRVSVLREFAIFVRLTPGRYDEKAYEELNDNLLYVDLQDPEYDKKRAIADESLWHLWEKGFFGEIRIEANDFEVAFRLNSHLTSVYEQLGPGTMIKDLNLQPVSRTFLKFTDLIDVKNAAVLKGNPKIVDRFSEFSDGILTFKEVEKISNENKLIRNTPVAEQSSVKTMGRSAFSRNGEIVPGMNDALNADTVNRATLQTGYWMQYVTDVSLERVDRPELDMRHLQKDEVSGPLNSNDKNKQSLKIKREFYRLFNEAAVVHPGSGDMLGLNFSILQKLAAHSEMSGDLLAMFQKHVIYIADPKNPHESIGIIADDQFLPFFEAFHIASRGSRVLFNEGAVDVRFNKHKRDKALFIYLNTVFMGENISFKHIVYPSFSKNFDPSRPVAQSEYDHGPGATIGLPGSRPLSKEEEQKDKEDKEKKKIKPKEEKPPRTEIRPASENLYRDMGSSDLGGSNRNKG